MTSNTGRQSSQPTTGGTTDTQKFEETSNKPSALSSAQEIQQDIQDGNEPALYSALMNACKNHQINNVLSELSPSELANAEHILDGQYPHPQAGPPPPGFPRNGSSPSSNSGGASGLSQGKRNALFDSMAQEGASATYLAKLAKSFTNGANIAGVLSAASNTGRIDQVLDDLSQGNLNTIARQLDASLSQHERNALFNVIASHGASGAELARLTSSLLATGAVANVIAMLTAASNHGQINQLLDHLSPGQIDTLGQDLDHLLADRRVSDKQLGELFDAIAKGGADYQQLYRLSHGLSSDGLSDASPNVIALANSVAHHSSSGTKLGYIQALAPGMTRDPTTAVAVGNVLASLKGNPTDVETAFDYLIKNKQLIHVMKVAVASPQSDDSVGLSAIINAASTIPSTASVTGGDHTKAQVFGDGAQVNGTSNQGNALGALTSLLATDPEGILYQLMSSEAAAQPAGGALTTYAQALIEKGSAKIWGSETATKVLAGLYARLRFGQTINRSDPNAYLNYNPEDARGLQQYQHAKVLGYFVGSLQNAGKNANSGNATADDIINAVGALLGPALAAAAAPEAPPWIVGAVGAAGGAAQQIVSQFTHVSTGENPGIFFNNKICAEVPNLSPAWEAYNGAWNLVVGEQGA